MWFCMDHMETGPCCGGTQWGCEPDCEAGYNRAQVSVLHCPTRPGLAPILAHTWRSKPIRPRLWLLPWVCSSWTLWFCYQSFPAFLFLMPSGILYFCLFSALVPVFLWYPFMEPKHKMLCLFSALKKLGILIKSWK